MTPDNKSNYSWLMVVVFLLLASTFVFDVWGEKPDRTQFPLVASEFYSKNPVRKAILTPVLYQDGYAYRCNDCHDLLEPSQVQKSFFSAHPEIVLDHGANNYCSTCHYAEDKEKLVDINGKGVSFVDSHLTCLQCHGPKYRDWEIGVHGRMNDYWDERQGQVCRLTCVACHDPHRPAFGKMVPAPAPHLPHTLIDSEGEE